MQSPTYDDVMAARARIAPLVVRTPMIRHPLLDQLTGGTILLKPETLQRTGSFKLRGASNAILQLDAAQRRAGIVTHSSGNHAQATAFAARSVGAAATIFMPDDAPAIKVENTRRWGAEIRRYNRHTDDREGITRAHAEASGAVLVPPFDHPDVIAGQGTLAIELVDDAEAAGLTMDAMLACTGGGGLIAGCALAIEGASPTTRVYAVEPAGWDDTGRSLASGRRESNPPGGSTLCDALLAHSPGRLTFEINHPRLAGGISVADEEVMAAIRVAFSHLKLVVEPGGAVCLAALLAGKFDARGKVVGAVLSGGNVDADVFGRALAG